MSKKPLTNGAQDNAGYPHYQTYYKTEALEISDSKATLAKKSSEYNSKTDPKLHSAALIVSWISVIFGFTSGTAAIVLGQILSSESLFGYGLDAVLDSLSSVAVLWRFYGNTSATEAEARERKACLVISIFFFVSAFSLIYKSSVALSKSERDEGEGRIFTIVFSSCCGVVALILATTKVYLGRRLDSRSLLTDSIITYAGALMSFLGVLGLELHRQDEQVWYLDAVFGLCCGVFLLTFGFKLLIQMTCLYKNHELLEEEEC